MTVAFLVAIGWVLTLAPADPPTKQDSSTPEPVLAEALASRAVAEANLRRIHTLIVTIRKLTSSDDSLRAGGINPAFEIVPSGLDMESEKEADTVRIRAWPQLSTIHDAFAAEFLVDRAAGELTISFSEMDPSNSTTVPIKKLAVRCKDGFVFLPRRVEGEQVEADVEPTELELVKFAAHGVRIALPNRVQACVFSSPAHVVLTNAYSRYQIPLQTEGAHGELIDGNGAPEVDGLPTLTVSRNGLWLQLADVGGFWLNQPNRPVPAEEAWRRSPWSAETEWQATAFALLSELEWIERRLHTPELPLEERAKVTARTEEIIQRLNSKVLTSASRSASQATERLLDVSRQLRVLRTRKAAQIQWAFMNRQGVISQLAQELEQQGAPK